MLIAADNIYTAHVLIFNIIAVKQIFPEGAC